MKRLTNEKKARSERRVVVVAVKSAIYTLLPHEAGLLRRNLQASSLDYRIVNPAAADVTCGAAS